MNFKEKERWTIEEIELLKKEYPIKYIEDLVILFPNRQEYSIIKKAKRLGLKKIIEKKKRHTFKQWTIDEIEIIKKYYPITENCDMCKYLPNRTHMSISSKARDMKIRKEYTYSWTDVDINFLKDNYKKYSIKELSEKLNKTESSILNMGHKFNLKQKEPLDLSYENCIATARLFKDKSSLRNKHPHMCDIASRNGWFEEMTSHMISLQFSTPQLICQFIFDNILGEKSSYNNRKVLKPYELDIYYEKLKLAIEYNGWNWHNTDVVIERDKNKKKICDDLGIYLIVIEQKNKFNKTYLRDIKDDIISVLDIINKKFNKNIKVEDVENMEVDVTDKIMDFNDVMEYCLKYDSYMIWKAENDPMYNMLRRNNKLEEFTKHMKRRYDKKF
jgi:hypothetical protein